MSASLLQRLVNRLLGKRDASSEAEEDHAPTAAQRSSVASDVDSKHWFSGNRPMPRDSIDSNPNSSRWFRKPKFVAPGDSLHHPSKIDLERTSRP